MDNHNIGPHHPARRASMHGHRGGHPLFPFRRHFDRDGQSPKRKPRARAAAGRRHSSFQISDTHIGFNAAANPDVGATLDKAIGLVNAMPVPPALVLHTGDITHLAKPAQFDTAAQLLSGLRMSELHTVPGEHDVTERRA